MVESVTTRKKPVLGIQSDVARSSTKAPIVMDGQVDTTVVSITGKLVLLSAAEECAKGGLLTLWELMGLDVHRAMHFMTVTVL